MKSLILQNLSFSLSHRALFDDFSVSIPQKARIGIVGRNGSGKSTLLRLIKDSLGPNIGFVPQIISEFDKLSKEMGVELYYPELKLCGDNAAMVGAQGYFEYISGRKADLNLNAYATMPIDKADF